VANDADELALLDRKADALEDRKGRFSAPAGVGLAQVLDGEEGSQIVLLFAPGDEAGE
jgi:hypothetical protein